MTTTAAVTLLVGFVGLLQIAPAVQPTAWSVSMVARVPGGDAGAGAPISTLDVDVTEVTVEQLRSCYEAGLCRDPGVLPKEPRWQNHPISHVTPAQAAQYCSAIGKRLPTEVEWEWIARGGPTRAGNPWRTTVESCKFAVLSDPNEGLGCGYGSTWPVTSLHGGATIHGILHMAGNVREWTSTMDTNCYVARGGDYASSADDGGIFERLQTCEPEGLVSDVGFRCVVDVED